MHFLSDEIPIRYAVRLKFIESLNKWETNSRLKEVHDIYLQSFKDMRMVSWDNGAEFRRMLMNVKTRHANVITLVLMGVQRLKVQFLFFFRTRVKRYWKIKNMNKLLTKSNSIYLRLKIEIIFFDR